MSLGELFLLLLLIVLWWKGKGTLISRKVDFRAGWFTPESCELAEFFPGEIEVVLT